MTRTPTQALAWTAAHRTGYNGRCQQYARDAYDIPAKAPTALAAWNAAEHKHTDLSTAPDGAFVFFSHPQVPAGHVGLLRDGKIDSTNSAVGHPGVLSLAYWQNQGYKVLGWTEDNNGVRVPGLAPKTPAKPSTPSGTTVLKVGSKGAKVKALQQGLRNAFPAYKDAVTIKRGQLITVDSSYGAQTAAWVSEFQERVGITVDGIAGPDTQAHLKKYGVTL